jgi:hypothetical protein
MSIELMEISARVKMLSDMQTGKVSCVESPSGQLTPGFRFGDAQHSLHNLHISYNLRLRQSGILKSTNGAWAILTLQRNGRAMVTPHRQCVGGQNCDCERSYNRIDANIEMEKHLFDLQYLMDRCLVSGFRGTLSRPSNATAALTSHGADI